MERTPVQEQRAVPAPPLAPEMPQVFVEVVLVPTEYWVLAIYWYFRLHCTHFFPAWGLLRRSTSNRQAAGLWKVRKLVWRRKIHIRR